MVCMDASGRAVRRGTLQTLLEPDVVVRSAGFATRIVSRTQGRLAEARLTLG